MSEKVKLGIIGIGNMGTAHINNIRGGACPEIEVAAVADINCERLEWAKSVLGDDLKCFNTAEELIDSKCVDAVLIAVPHYFHPPYAIRSMKNGLHVMSEKPAGVYTKQVKEMNKVADECNVKFGMMFNQRTVPVYRKLKEIVSSGEMGNLRRVNWLITNWYRNQSYYDSGAWRATWSGEGGGVLLNQCPHNLDLWQWICGMPSKVSAHMYFGKWHDIEVEDDVTAFVEYPNGATGTFITTTGDTPGTNRLEMDFDKGKIVCEGDKIEMWKSEITEQEYSRGKNPGFSHPDHEYSIVPVEGVATNHAGVLNAFAGAILRDEPMLADGREGINGLTISNAMHLSAWLGREIELPFDDELYYEELMKRVKTSRRKENVQSVVSDTSGSYNS